jgi:hypothetical protein
VGVEELDAVPDPDGETVPVGVEEKVIVVEPVPETEPVFEELAPVVNDAVGVREMDRERLIVELGVIEDVPVVVPVGELVGVPLLVALGETLGLSEILAVSLALAPIVTDGVAEFDSDALRLDVEEGVGEDVPVSDDVPDPLLVCDGVGGGDIDADKVDDVVGDPLSLPDGVWLLEGVVDAEIVVDDEAVPLAEPPMDCVVVGVGVLLAERVAVSVAGADTAALSLTASDVCCVCVSEGRGAALRDDAVLCVAGLDGVGGAEAGALGDAGDDAAGAADAADELVGASSGAGVSLVDCEAVLLCVADCVSEHVGDDDGVPLPLTSGENVVVVEGLGLRVAVAVTLVEEVSMLDNVCVSVPETDGVWVAVGEPLGDGDAVAELLPRTVKEAVGVTVLDADRDGVPDRERVTLGDTLALAPGDKVDVGVPVDVCERVGDNDGVLDVVAYAVEDRVFVALMDGGAQFGVAPSSIFRMRLLPLSAM